MNRYEALAGQLEGQIRDGHWPTGQRLPSVREMSAHERVSPSTVVEAYGLLRDRGWIEARERSGFYVAARLSPTPPPEVSAKPALLGENFRLAPEDLVFALRQATLDPKILPLGAATPSATFYPNRALVRSLGRVLRDEPALSSEYVFPPGSRGLREAVAARYRRFGVDLDAESVVTTTGATEAIALSLQAVAKPGDVVLLESPTYFGTLQTVKALGYRILEVPAHPTSGLEPEKLEEAVRKYKSKLRAAILVPNHSNPLGARAPEQSKAELVRIAARAGIVLIEDDAYGELSHEMPRPKPLKAYDRADNVILCGTFSKTVAPGLRVGFAISSQHARVLADLRTALTCGVGSVSEEAVGNYLADGAFDRHLRRVSREYATLTTRFAHCLREVLPAGTRVNQPLGGYVLWLQLPDGMDSRLVQKRALEEKISVASGSMFSAQGAYRDCLRINCALPWSPVVERGLARLGRVVESCRRR